MWWWRSKPDASQPTPAVGGLQRDLDAQGMIAVRMTGITAVPRRMQFLYAGQPFLSTLHGADGTTSGPSPWIEVPVPLWGYLFNRHALPLEAVEAGHLRARSDEVTIDFDVAAMRAEVREIVDGPHVFATHADGTEIAVRFRTRDHRYAQFMTGGRPFTAEVKVHDADLKWPDEVCHGQWVSIPFFTPPCGENGFFTDGGCSGAVPLQRRESGAYYVEHGYHHSFHEAWGDSLYTFDFDLSDMRAYVQYHDRTFGIGPP